MGKSLISQFLLQKNYKRCKTKEIKEFVCIYGKIEESVFDDGQIYINVITSRFENISQIESFIEGYDNLATACS